MKLRAIVLAAAGAGIPLALLVLVLPLNWGYGGYIETANGPTGTVEYVDPAGPAYAAGLREGQRVVRAVGHAQLLEDAGPVGTLVPIQIVEPQGVRTVTVRFVRYTGTLALQQNLSKVLDAATALLAFAICILVALRARDQRIAARATGVLLIAALAAFSEGVALVSGNVWVGALCYFALPVAFSMAAVGAALLFLRVYPPKRSPVRRFGAYVSPVPPVFGVAYGAAWLHQAWTGTAWFPALLSSGSNSALFQLACLAMLAAAIADGMIGAGEESAAAMRWLGGMWLLATALSALSPIGRVAGIGVLGYSHYNDILASASVFCMAFGVAYPILRHRLVDLNILVSRATIFAAVSAIIVGIFVAAEWAIGRIFEQSFGLSSDRAGWTAQLLTLGVVLALGISARSIHRFVDERLTAVFFKKRIRALSEITRVAKESDASTDAQAVLRIACDTVQRALQPRGAACYLRGGEGYERAAEAGESIFAPSVGFNDPVALRLRRWQEPFEIDDESDARLHVLYLPMTLRGELLGFIACGPKPDRTAYLADEVAALSLLAHHAGIAAAWLNRVPALTPQGALTVVVP